MFGMGFTEIIVIVIIAILFLGPDKLPSTMVDIAKFFRQIKSTIGSVKESIEDELHVSDIQNEVLNYKKELLDAGDNIKKSTHIDDLDLASLNNLSSIGNNIIDDAIEPKVYKEPQKSEKVTFKKKKKEDKNEEVEKVIEKEDTNV